jgi:hypothetical protein
MPALSIEEKKSINCAFELAYLIIPDKGIALRIAEDAWCALDLMLGKQERRRKLYKQPLGYIKWEERSRPLRTKIRLSDEQMLQWLVYVQCDSWERATEYADSPYSPRMEDMVVRYIKHLVRMTLNRNSFYVTLAVTRLLYEYGPHEVRLMYDVLTMSDSARMKDIKYLRKQKAKLMDECLMRFDGMLQTVTTPYREKRFESQPITEQLIRLVNKCLYRFTPWNTDCTVQESFDPTAISGLYFSETKSADEDQIEMNRIHAILHPDCFSRLVTGLSEFVKRLPPDSPDKSCNYDSLDRHLAVPRFHNVADKDQGDDRFHPPKLESEDYLQLQRNRDALARRRRMHPARPLSVYVDDVERASFDPRRTSRIQLDVEPETGVIEVRSKDAHGTLALATLIICCDDIPSGESFRDWVVLEGGQRLTIQLRPVRDANGDVETAKVEVSYTETSPIRAVSLFTQRTLLRLVDKGTVKAHREESDVAGAHYVWIGKAGLVAALLIAAVVLMWLQLKPIDRDIPPVPRADTPQIPEAGTAPPIQPRQPPRSPQVGEQPARLIARAAWSRDPKAANQAIRLETARGEMASVEISRRQPNLLIALPRADLESRAYTHYRATLLATERRIWQQTLRAPLADSTGYAHVLNVFLSSQPRVEGESFVLQFDGKTREGWKSIGQVTLQVVAR